MMGFSTMLDLINTTKTSWNHQNMHAFSFVYYNQEQSHMKMIHLSKKQCLLLTNHIPSIMLLSSLNILIVS